MPLVREASLLASDEAGKLFSVIAASEVEGLVLGQVRQVLTSPELVARTIMLRGFTSSSQSWRATRRPPRLRPSPCWKL
jgi:hypothetical protein